MSQDRSICPGTSVPLGHAAPALPSCAQLHLPLWLTGWCEDWKGSEEGQVVGPFKGVKKKIKHNYIMTMSF